MAGRQSPAAKTTVRTTLGTQHATDVDTLGMRQTDPDMFSQVMEHQVQPQPKSEPNWFQSIGKHISGMFQGKGPGRPAASHPPAAPILTQAQADSVYNKYVK